MAFWQLWKRMQKNELNEGREMNNWQTVIAKGFSS